MNLHDGRRRKSLFELPIRKSQSRSARCRCPLGIESGKTRSMRRRRAPLTASEFRHHYAIAAVNGWNHVATEFDDGFQLIQVAAASTTIPVTNAAMPEYSKISLRTLTIALSPTRGFPCAPRLSGTSRHIGRRSVTNSITKKSEMGQKNGSSRVAGGSPHNRERP